MEGINLTEGKLSKNMKRLLMPLIFTNILNSIYSIVDGIWVGNLTGDMGVAAITNSYPVICAVVAISTGMAIGASVLISQYYGAKKYDKVKTTIGVAYILTTIIGFLAVTFSILFLDRVLKIIKVPTEIFDMTKNYIIIYLIGDFSFFIFDLITQSLRAIGDSKTPMVITIVMTTINIVLDPILIKGGLGVFGAGLSTAISIIFGTTLAIIHVNKKSKLLKFDLKKIEIKKEYIKNILKIAFPVILQELFISLTYMIELNVVNQMGVIGTAAYGVVEKVASVIYIIGTSFQTLMTVAIGQFIGNNKIDSTKEVIKEGIKLSIIPIILSIIILFIFPRESCRLFISSNEVIEVAVKYIHLISIISILIPIRGIITGFILGTGHTKYVFFAMVCSGITEFIMLYLLKNIDSITRIGIAVTTFWSVKMILELIYYLSGNWKKKAIEDEMT